MVSPTPVIMVKTCHFIICVLTCTSTPWTFTLTEIALGFLRLETGFVTCSWVEGPFLRRGLFAGQHFFGMVEFLWLIIRPWMGRLPSFRKDYSPKIQHVKKRKDNYTGRLDARMETQSHKVAFFPTFAKTSSLATRIHFRI